MDLESRRESFVSFFQRSFNWTKGVGRIYLFIRMVFSSSRGGGRCFRERRRKRLRRDSEFFIGNFRERGMAPVRAIDSEAALCIHRGGRNTGGIFE